MSTNPNECARVQGAILEDLIHWTAVAAKDGVDVSSDYMNAMKQASREVYRAKNRGGLWTLAYSWRCRAQNAASDGELVAWTRAADSAEALVREFAFLL